MGVAPKPRVTGPFHPQSLQLLQQALDWWQAQGFQLVDLPWMVPAHYAEATRPSFCRDVQTLYGSFVGSGEQSFLQLWAEGALPADAPGYIGWTPCLRDERLDETHQHGFMKAEWFKPVDGLPSAEGMQLVRQLALRQAECFRYLAMGLGYPEPTLVLEYQSDLQVDLVLGNQEVGSYGWRLYEGKAYLYGTALALPRFTQALLK